MRLDEQKEYFMRCSYPKKMVTNIHKKTPGERVMAVSTHGRDEKPVRTLEDIEKNFLNINFRFVKKTAPSLRSILVMPKTASLYRKSLRQNNALQITEYNLF